MSKLSKNMIRRLIMQEISKMVGEDAIIEPNGKDNYRNTGFNPNARSPHNMTMSKPSDSYSNFGGGSTCSRCGCNEVYEGMCEQCGSMESSLLEGKMCEQCVGAMYEGDCGCSTGCGCRKTNDKDYNFISDHMYGQGAKDMNDMQDALFSRFPHLDQINMEFDHGHDDDGQLDGHKYHNNNYMAKPSLYKVAKYSQKLLQMIPDGYELDDWQRTKIAQIADDISEVYHSLDYDFHDEY